MFYFFFFEIKWNGQFRSEIGNFGMLKNKWLIQFIVNDHNKFELPFDVTEEDSIEFNEKRNEKVFNYRK